MIDPAAVLTHLRRCGVAVHHARWMPGEDVVVVFLEGALGQGELAETAVRRLPGVWGVRFSGHLPRAVMFVAVGPTA